MAVGSSPHEHSWSAAGALPDAAPVGRAPRGSPSGAPTEGALDLRLVRAAIEDGLLMVFGPDGDPVPPQVFGAAAAAQPDAAVRLADGEPVRAERVARVLDAQISGRLGSGSAGGEAWIRAMLVGAAQPEMARSDALLCERCTVDVVAFGSELMLTSPSGATFLLAAARSRTPVSLRVAGGGSVAVGDLVARLLARNDQGHPSSNEFAAPACETWLEGDALRIALPAFGVLDLTPTDDDIIATPSVSLFRASGELAALDDLLSALSMPIASVSGHAGPLDGASPPTPPAASLRIGLPDPLAAAPDRVALVVVRGLPKGARLSAGVESGDGGWLLSPCELSELSVTLPPDWAADLALEVTAIAMANAEGELTSAMQTVFVPLRSAAMQPPPAAAGEPGPSRSAGSAPAAGPAPRSPVCGEPAPALAVGPGSACPVEPVPAATPEPASSPAVEPVPPPRDQPARRSIPLGLDPQTLSGDGPVDAVIARDLPAGMTLSAGTYDPAIAGWVLLPHQLSGLSVIAESGQGAHFTLCLLGVGLHPRGEARPRVLARVPVTTG